MLVSRSCCARAFLFAGLGLSIALASATDGAKAAPTRSSLRSAIGVPHGLRLLSSVDRSEVARGIRRLGRIGSRDAIHALVNAAEDGTLRLSEAETRLALIRALSPLARSSERARAGLALAFDLGRQQTGASHRRATSMCAQALAQTRTEDGYRPLVVQLLLARSFDAAANDSVAAIARRAIVEAPPGDIRLLTSVTKAPHPSIVELLGEIGDPRAIKYLRKVAQNIDASKVSRGIAMVALAKLDDDTSRLLRRRFARSKSALARVHAISASVYVEPSFAVERLRDALASPRWRPLALKLIERFPALNLQAELVALIKRLPNDARLRERITDLLLRNPSAATLSFFRGELSEPNRVRVAAMAIARTPASAAAEMLAEGYRQSKDPNSRALILRAITLRAIEGRDDVPGSHEAVNAAATGTEGPLHDVGLFALVATGWTPLVEVLKVAKPADRPAIERGAWVRGVDAVRTLARKWGAADDAAVVARHPSLLWVVDPRVSGQQLLEWSREFSFRSPVATYRLAQRDPVALRESVDALLHTGTVDMRAHCALGLGMSPNGDATHRLSTAYWREGDVRVRAAIARALSLRLDHSHLLQEIAHSDPGSIVRRAARRGLRGRAPVLAEVGPWEVSRQSGPGRLATWVVLASANRGGRAAQVLLQRNDGMTIPLTASPDGVVITPAIPLSLSYQTRVLPQAPLAPSNKKVHPLAL